MNKKLASAKEFVVKHKVAIAVTATTVVCYKLHMAIINQHNNFLKDHGLFEAFYRPEE